MLIFYDKLKILRKESGINQTEIAKYLGIDQTTMSKIENGERTISLDLLNKLCELYVCTLESLLDENKRPEIIKMPFRSKDATSNDFCQISKANRIILNLKEMLNLKEK